MGQNENFKYGIYDPSEVSSGYFGPEDTNVGVDDFLASSGIVLEEEEIKPKGIVASFKEDFVSGAKALGSDIRKIQTGRLEETTGLLGKFFKAGEKRTEKIQETFDAIDTAGGGTIDKGIVGALNVFGAGVDFGGDVFMSGMKTLAPEGLENATKETVQDFIQTDLGKSTVDFIKKGGEKYEGFKESSPEANRFGLTVEAFLPLLELVGAGRGAKVGKEFLEEGLEAGVEFGKKQIPKISKGLDVIETGISKGLKQTKSKIAGVTPTGLSQKIAGIDDQSIKVLKETTTEKFDDFLNVAKEAAEDIKKQTPLSKAGDKAQDTISLISNAKSKAGANKSKLLKAIETQTIDTKPFLDDFNDFLSDRFNMKLSDNLEIVAITGKKPNIAKKSIGELQDLSDELLDLFTQDKIDLGNLDATIDSLQDAINFNKIQRGPAGTATKTESQISSFIEKSINKRLKDVAGQDFIDANNEFRRLLDLETRLSKSLGPKGERGEGLMKAVFSPVAGEKTKRIFREIEEEFGIDLINEAALAKFVMQAVGDVRQANLLEALDLGPGFSTIQSGKIAEILDFVAKKAFSPERVGRGLTK